MANLAFFYELRHGSDGFFNRRVGIDAMLVIQIDRLNPQPPEAAFAGLANIVGFAVQGAGTGGFGITDDAEFRGQHNFVALAFEGAAHKLLVRVWAVNVGGIEEIDAEFKSTLNRGDRFMVVTGPVEF